MNIDRRRAVGSIAGLAATGLVTAERLSPKYQVVRNRARSRVAVLNLESYTQNVEQELLRGLRLFRLAVAGKKVVLKPNLVESLPGPVNTNPVLIAAAARCFLRLGARSVVVAEGPGHETDTEAVVIETGVAEQLRGSGVDFVDLNRDELVEVGTLARFTSLESLCLPKTVLGADLLVSMPKMKTHHWAGVTLSLKNMFGVIPGAKYGWPKNILHWRGIDESIMDICATVPVGFVIADGIVAMEGNGPLNGSARELHRVVLADDPVAADATCCRLMGLNPARIGHIDLAARFLGNAGVAQIEQLGEALVPPAAPFRVLPEFQHVVES